MATWENEKLEDRGNADEVEENLNSILVTHDLQDCLDDSLDLPSFVRIYGQCDEDFDYEDPPYNESLHGDNTGYVYHQQKTPIATFFLSIITITTIISRIDCYFMCIYQAHCPSVFRFF